MGAAVTHSLADMMAEAAKHYTATLERLIKPSQVCMDCRVAPVEVIHRPPTIEVAVVDVGDGQLQTVGLDALNPYLQDTSSGLRVTLVLRLLCLECSRRRTGL